MTKTALNSRFSYFAAIASCAFLLPLTGCNEPRASDVGAQPTLPEVGFVVVKPRPIAVVRDLPGRVAPTRVADVRPRVGGLLIKRRFEQGSHVTIGDALYEIDPSFYRAELDSAKAEVARAEATLSLAEKQSERTKTLMEQQASSRAQFETAFASLRQAEAALAGAKAAQNRAELNLAYTTVRAPITGRIGRALVTEGALIDQGTTTSLATIQQLDPIYVDITQSVGELRKLRRDLASGELSRIAPDVATVKLILEDGDIYEHRGRLLFSEVTADPTTGQVTLRVEIPNPANELFAGMYVRARIDQAIDSDAIAIPQQAVQRDVDGNPEVFLVGNDDTVSRQTISLGDIVGGLWVVQDGLKDGQRVVVDGFQRISAGVKVASKPLADGNASDPATSARAAPTSQ